MADKLQQFIDESDTSAEGELLDSSNESQEEKYSPQYRVLTEQRIPIAKTHGKLWKSRKEAALGKLRENNDIERWDEAIRYYRNDQSNRSMANENGEKLGVNLTTTGMETENIVFANVTSLVPAVYAKNPSVECTSEDPAHEEWSRAAKRLINTLFSRKTSYGINLKPKMRRAVVMATLTNYAFAAVSYTQKEESNEQTLKDIDDIGKELIDAKEISVIRELEGKLQALEAKVDFLNPPGPSVKIYSPKDVLIDPDATEWQEKKWLMYAEYLSTEYIHACYAQKNEKGELVSVYKPTHLLRNNTKNALGHDDDPVSFASIGDESKTYKDYGFADETSYNKALRTKVWYVWDKTTRRVYMYNDEDWSWPIWVWDDPYGLPDFFNMHILEFYTDPCEMYARGETTYYLDQQDAINAINNEVAKTREYISGKVIYNKSIIKDENAVDSFLKGTKDKRALGIEAPIDTDLSKLFSAFMPTSAAALNTVVFDKSRSLEAIDRVSSVTNVMRGVEYKTNTTNRAIESYESGTQTRLDEKIDMIEDFIGAIGADIMFLCVKFMPDEVVAELIGQEAGTVWATKKPSEVQLANLISIRVLGGSTLKPTSAMKKQQALQFGQILGQFSQQAPVAFFIALKVMQKAFDDVVIRSEDWELIKRSVQQQLEQGGTVVDKDNVDGMQSNQGADLIGQLEQMIDQLPDQLRTELGSAIAQGMPVREAVAKIGAILQTQQQTQPEGMMQ